MKDLPIRSACITFGIILGTAAFLIPTAWAHPILV